MDDEVDLGWEGRATICMVTFSFTHMVTLPKITTAMCSWPHWYWVLTSCTVKLCLYCERSYCVHGYTVLYWMLIFCAFRRHWVLTFCTVKLCLYCIGSDSVFMAILCYTGCWSSLLLEVQHRHSEMEWCLSAPSLLGRRRNGSPSLYRPLWRRRRRSPWRIQTVIWCVYLVSYHWSIMFITIHHDHYHFSSFSSSSSSSLSWTGVKVFQTVW